MPVMDMSGAIASFGSTYTLKTGSAGTSSSGFYTPGTYSNSTITALVQPVQGEELERLPEGTRVDEVMVVYTAANLSGANEATGKLPDVLVVNGVDYHVESVERWDGLGNYFRVLVRREDTGQP